VNGHPDTSTLSDALDRLSVDGQVLGIRPLSPTFRVQGPAFTVRLVPTGGRGGTGGDFIDDVERGAVVVLDNGGRTDVTVWGDILTLAATVRGAAGTVIHGVCRDAVRIVDSGYPVFSRGAYMRTGRTASGRRRSARRSPWAPRPWRRATWWWATRTASWSCRTSTERKC
jgi:regulator of RNase E activity RraA